LGPLMQVVAFEKMIGSFGISKFCSNAWSRKFKPMPRNLDGLETQAPILKLLSNCGSLEISNFFIVLISNNIII
jgi:hypothetical protein